ncbi:MAG: HupE/UreJ family protein [Planctomycetota bacterium]
MKTKLLLFAFLSFAWVPNVADAHSTDESYIWLNAQADRLDGRVEVRLADLRRFLKLDVPEDFDAAREAVLALSSELEAYVEDHFQITTEAGAEIPYKITRVDLLDNEFFGHFAQLFFETDPIEVPARIRVTSTLLFEFDKYSRCLLCMDYNHFTGKTHKESFHHAIFTPWTDTQDVDFNNIQQVQWGRKYFIWEGIRHIWIGTDHILFLVTLLLPSVLIKRPIPNTDEVEASHGMFSKRYEWVPVESFGAAFWSIFKIVTIFTVAHSITLALASLDKVSLPARLVESVIAFSIIVVALNNIIPTFREKTWIVLFLFGLFHGLGFASVMQNLPFRMPNLVRLLLYFNIGVEIGQLAIVAAVFPFIYALRKWKLYQPVLLIGCSAIICVIAGFWFVQRALGLG